MLKVFLCLAVKTSLVVSLEKEFFQPEAEITSGLVTLQSNFAYSFFHKPADCQKLVTWRVEYTKLKNLSAPLPDILKIHENPDDNNECHIFFKNVFLMNLKISRSTPALVDSFKKLLSAFEKGGSYKYFDISFNSFAYQPESRSFVFVDIENLETLDNSVNGNGSFKKEMAKSFLNSLRTEGISLSIFDLIDLKEFEVDINTFPQNMIYKDKLRAINIVSEFNLETEKKNPFSFRIEIEKRENIFDFKIIHKTKITAYNLIRRKDTFRIFLCKEKYSIDLDCSNVKVTDMDPKSIQAFLITPNQRIDIEVQESFVQKNNWNLNEKYRNKAFYEIFVILRNGSSFGITGSETFYNQNNFFNILDNDLILCETTSQKIITYYTQYDIPYVNTYMMESLPIKLEPKYQLKRITQISPYLLKDPSFIFPEQVRRVFYISQGAVRNILKKNTQSGKIESIYYFDVNIATQLLILSECNNPSSKFSLQPQSDHTQLILNSSSKKYPSPITMMSESSSFTKEYKMCLKKSDEDSSSLTFEEGDSSNRFFRWNFNSHAQAENHYSIKSVVYFSEKRINDDPGFQFRDFAWPIAKQYVLFISISKQNSSSNFSVQVVFYKDDNMVYNILYSDKVEMSFSKLPYNFSYNKDNSRNDDTSSTQYFSDCDAVYLSDNEVIYQLEIVDFKKCDPTLIVENDSTFRIYCEFCVFNCDGTRLTGKTLSPGLKRVTYQAKPLLKVNELI